MNQMLLSFLQRQGKQGFDENFAENDEDHPCWQQNGEYQNTEQEASVSSSLIPLQYHTLHHQESWQHNSFAHQSSNNVPVCVGSPCFYFIENSVFADEMYSLVI